MRRYDYEIITVPTTQDAAQLRTRLNAMGKQGWECFAIIPHKTGGDVRHYFKRRTADASPAQRPPLRKPHHHQQQS